MRNISCFGQQHSLNIRLMSVGLCSTRNDVVHPVKFVLIFKSGNNIIVIY